MEGLGLFGLARVAGVVVVATMHGLAIGQAGGQAGGKFGCSVNSAPASDADAAFSREEYGAALDLYKAMADKQSEASRAGVIRTLLEQNQLGEARQLADAWVKEKPQSAQAQASLGEVLLRGGEIPEAYQALATSASIDKCNGRMYYTLSRIEHTMANFASSRSHVVLAHQLSPNDPEIRWAWLGTLPRDARLREETALVTDERLLNAHDRAALKDGMARVPTVSKDDCGVAGTVEKATIAMKPILNGPENLEGLALDGYINGKRKRLEIDTGASGLVLSRSAAAGLGLTMEQHYMSRGIGDRGDVSTGMAHVDSVKIGDVEFKNCTVEALEKATALDIDGLIGGDFFDKFVLTLDFPKSEVRLDPLPARPDDPKTDGAGPVAHNRYVAPEMKDWTKIYRVGHDLLLPVSIGDAKDRLFLVDTGSSLMFISPTAARAVTHLSGESRYEIHGISGKVNKVGTADHFDLIFAHMKLPVEDMQSIDMTRISHDNGVEVSGFMGASLLHMLTVHIDYRDNLMKFEYKRDK